MGIRGELFSTKVALQNRTYFFNVKENRLGDLYLNIVESKNRETGGFERQSVILFADDLPEFLKGFDESLRVLEKADREKKRGRGRTAPRAGPSGNPSGEDRRTAGTGFHQERNQGRDWNRDAGQDRGQDRDRGRRTGEEGGHKRVVFKKGKSADSFKPPAEGEKDPDSRPRKPRPRSVKTFPRE